MALVTDGMYAPPPKVTREELRELVRPYLSLASDGNGCTTSAEAAAAFVRRVTDGAVNLEFKIREELCYVGQFATKEQIWAAPIPPGWAVCCFNHGCVGSTGYASTKEFRVELEIGFGAHVDSAIEDYRRNGDPADVPPEDLMDDGRPRWTSEPYLWTTIHQYAFVPASLFHLLHRITHLDEEDYDDFHLPGETEEQFAERLESAWRSP